jgi:exodeoxyribonuclease VII small subunit
MTSKADDKDLKFEQALQVLESIAERMNSGKEDLDTMLSLYEEGIGYLKICKAKLADAEMRVQVLNERMKKELPELAEDENG